MLDCCELCEQYCTNVDFTTADYVQERYCSTSQMFSCGKDLRHHDDIDALISLIQIRNSTKQPLVEIYNMPRVGERGNFKSGRPTRNV